MPLVVLFLVSLGILALTAEGTGRSYQHRTQDDRGNYAFSYNIEDPFGFSNGRWEIGDEFGNKRGGYTIAEPNGQSRYVEYVADAKGFRIVYQGTLPQKPHSFNQRIASPDECTVHGAHYYGHCVPGRVLTQREIDYAPLIAMESYNVFESTRAPRARVKSEPLINVPPVREAARRSSVVPIPSYQHSEAPQTFVAPTVYKRKLKAKHNRKKRRQFKRAKWIEVYA